MSYIMDTFELPVHDVYYYELTSESVKAALELLPASVKIAKLRGGNEHIYWKRGGDQSSMESMCF